MDDGGQFLQNVTLNPGDFLDFHLFHEIRGGAFVAGSSYSALLNAVVSFDAINLTNPPPPISIAEPDMLFLLTSGFLGFLFLRKISAQEAVRE